MASTNAVWGIDIGQCALKALKLRAAGDGKVEAVAFDVIEHPKLLSQPDADRDELIASALEKFASRNDWQGDQFVIGVPGQQTFARFCKLPPLDLKKDAGKLHNVVRYEASQQIPFDMDDVVWDYQVFTSDGSPDIEVGIFAIRKDLIRKHLGYFSAVGIAPSAVQAIPAALYNYARFDGQAVGEGGATVMIDVGAQNTDLIIVEPNSAWTRNIPLGGNSFTEALVRSFKLSFAKAESLKRSAATSKYARQIFQAMRPVFAELVAEIQRSIGFYSSTHREVELKRVLALGNAFRLPGLQKYLENNLTVAGGVGKLERFANLLPSATINAPNFTENILSFGAAYGLALQGLGLARIHASLLPPEMARIAVWRKKRPYFMATAAALLLAAGVPWVANALDARALSSDRAQQAQARTAEVLRAANTLKENYDKARTDTGQREKDIENVLQLQKHKLVVPRLVALVHEAMPPVNPPELADKLATISGPEELKKLIAANPEKFKRTERGQLILESFAIEYVGNVDGTDLTASASSGGGGGAPPIQPGAGAGGMPPPMAMFGSGSAGPGSMGGGPPMPMGGGGPPSGGPAGAEGSSPGFVVRLQGRLLYKTSRADASAWLESQYYTSLCEQGRQPGLGFYIPEDDPKDKMKRAIGEPMIRSYFASGFTPGASPGAQPYADPATGEDARNDWSVSFAFKVKLGEMPKPAEKPADKQ